MRKREVDSSTPASCGARSSGSIDVRHVRDAHREGRWIIIFLPEEIQQHPCLVRQFPDIAFSPEVV